MRLLSEGNSVFLVTRVRVADAAVDASRTLREMRDADGLQGSTAPLPVSLDEITQWRRLVTSPHDDTLLPERSWEAVLRSVEVRLGLQQACFIVPLIA